MNEAKLGSWLIVVAVLAGCRDDNASETSQATDTTSGTETGGTATDASSTSGEGTGASTETSGTTTPDTGTESTSGTDSTNSTTGSPVCPVRVWEGVFVGAPSELTGYTQVNGDVLIEETEAEDLQGMECLESVLGFISIRANPALTSLQGLERLRQVGTLRIVENPILADMSALGSSLTTVGGRFTIEGNAVLASLHGLEALTNVGENLEIVDNAAIVDLAGLSSLSVVGGIFGVASNASLVSCGGPKELVTVGGLSVVTNEKLPSLAGLETITNIGTPLIIQANPAITDVSAIMGAKVGETALIRVKDNPALPQCAAEALVAAVKPMSYSGTEDVSGNQGTCP